jgi:hypothetical protein
MDGRRRIRVVMASLMMAAACSDGGGNAGDAGADLDAAIDAPPIDAPPIDAAATTVTVRTWSQTLFPGVTAEDATWVAIEDGGTWTVVTGTDGVYRHDVRAADERYGVAVVCPVTGNVQVVHATLTEGARVDVVCARAVPVPNRRMQVTVSTPGPCAVTVSYPTTTWTTRCGVSNLGDVLSGPHDLLAVASSGVERAYVARDVDSAAWTVDLQDATLSRPSTAAQVGAGATDLISAFFYTQRGYLLLASAPGPRRLGGVPAALRRPEDIHLIQSGVFVAYTRRYLRELADVDLASLPVTVTPSATVTRTAADWEPYLASGFQIGFGGWALSVSAGWLDGASRYDYPRLCDVAGFPRPCADADPATTWTFTAVKPALGFSAPLPAIAAALGSPLLATDGLTFTAAVAQGSL